MKFITPLKLAHKIKSGGEKKIHDKNWGLNSFNFSIVSYYKQILN
jgi:hypothetical protein